MSDRDRRLAQTKYAGKESASEKAARRAREKAERDARKGGRKASRHQTAPAVPPPSKADRSGEFDAAAWYDEYRNTPQSRKNRRAHKNNIPSDAESGGGEAFADRSARSTTRWFSGMFG